MPTAIKKPAIIPAAGTRPKIIEEFVGRVNSGTGEVSIARMKSPAGWVEPGQCPEFDEYTLVLKGALHVETRKGNLVIQEGEALATRKGEWVRYSTPGPAGAEYVAICLPAFSPELVHRDSQESSE